MLPKIPAYSLSIVQKQNTILTLPKVLRLKDL